MTEFCRRVERLRVLGLATVAMMVFGSVLVGCNLSSDHDEEPLGGLDAGDEEVGDDGDAGGDDADAAGQCVRENDRDFCERVDDECGLAIAEDNCGDLREVNCDNFIDYGCGDFEECLEDDGEAGHNVCECLSLSDEELGELICDGTTAECGLVTAADLCSGWDAVGDIDCGGCDGGEECGEVFDNICGCPCEIDGQCYASGDPEPDEECSVCDPAQSETGFSTAADGTLCDDEDPCTWSDCQDGECVSHSLCEGTDDECGCASCVDCTEDDGWYEVGEEYDCCDGASVCTCQDEEYREYRCGGLECDYVVTSERTEKWSCDACEAGPGVDAICSDGECVEDCGSDTYCDNFGVCADLDSDDDHCGDCGEACPSDEACIGGSCECVPDCEDKECGSDGCGGDCGECGPNEFCGGGTCDCLTACAINGCGPDGCGGSCGSCPEGEWVDVGNPYSCCDGGMVRCTECQDQEYIEYSCESGVCESEPTDFRTEKSNCDPCPDDCACEFGDCPGNLCLQ